VSEEKTGKKKESARGTLVGQVRNKLPSDIATGQN
jgi:hypothetical protein